MARRFSSDQLIAQHGASGTCQHKSNDSAAAVFDYDAAFNLCARLERENTAMRETLTRIAHDEPNADKFAMMAMAHSTLNMLEGSASRTCHSKC